jgi:hypothetical protein
MKKLSIARPREARAAVSESYWRLVKRLIARTDYKAAIKIFTSPERQHA